MKNNPLREKALERYHSHALNSWILSLICALFIAALLLLGIVFQMILIILIPLVIMPFFFACVISHLRLKEKDELSGKRLFRYFNLFYRPPFNSSFSIIVSFLKSLLVEVVISIIVTGIMYAFYVQSASFNQTINDLLTALSNRELTNELLTQLLEANNNELSNFIYLSDGFRLIAFFISFSYFVTKEEITIYIRLKLSSVPIAGKIAKAAVKTADKKYNKNFFVLNWPLFVIMLLGSIGGLLLSMFAFHNYLICGTLAISIGTACSALYLPFYFSNMEILSEQLSVDIASFSEDYIKNVFEKYGVDVEINTINDNNEVVDGIKNDSDDTESN